MDDTIILFTFIIIVVCAFAAGAIAGSKGRSALGWGWVGFLFGPLGVLAALIASPAVAEVKIANDEGRIPCPECAELIMPEAKRCRFCGASVTGLSV